VRTRPGLSVANLRNSDLAAYRDSHTQVLNAEEVVDDEDA